MGLGKGEGSGGSHPSPDKKVSLGDPNLWWRSTRSLAGAVMGMHGSIQGEGDLPASKLWDTSSSTVEFPAPNSLWAASHRARQTTPSEG